MLFYWEQDKITGNTLEGTWEASGGKFSVEFDSFDIEGRYKYESRAKNGKAKAKIYDDGERIGYFKADYGVVSSFSGGESGKILLNTENGRIQLFEDGDLFAVGVIPEVNNYI